MLLKLSDRRRPGKINIFREGDETPPPGDGEQNNQQGNQQQQQKPKMFTQEEVNRMMKADKDRAKKENEQLASQLRSLNEQGLTPENIGALQSRIEELENFGKSQEQLAKEAQAKLQKKYDAELATAKSGEATWKKNYEDYRLDTEIKTAARDKKARNADQVHAILRSRAVLRPILDDSKKPTGQYDTRVLWNEKGENGEDVSLELSVTDAVARMFDSPDHANLFESGSVGGIGGYQNASGTKGKQKDPGDMSMDEYNAWRDAQKKKR